MKKNGSIEKYILEKGLCNGCGICTQVTSNKVKMEMKEVGLYRPVFDKDLTMEEWEQIAYVCPALNMFYPSYEDNDIPLYGKAFETKIGWSGFEDIRFQASSGGGLTAFLIFLLEHEKVDGIIQVGRKNNQFEAKGCLSTSIEEVKKSVGSLYMPVSLFENLRELLDCVQKVAVVGKGCDIRGLNRFLEIYPEYKEKIVITIGILCGGVPSIHGTHKILDIFDVENEAVESFRYRGYGWPGLCTAELKTGEKKTMTYNDAWAKHLGPTSPLACKVCFDGIVESADLVFGDAWKCENGNYPSFEETEGRNLIICRNKEASDLLGESVGNRYLTLSEEEVDNQMFKIMQPSQSNRRYLAKLKVLGLQLLGFKYPKVNKKYLEQVSKASGVKLSITRQIRTVLGSIKRARKASEVRK